MERLRVIGGNQLKGSLTCAGSKNAALPMLAASILCDAPVVFKNLPYLQDITTMFELLGSMGADITLDESGDFQVDASKLNDVAARYELVKTMRASILVLGALIGKYGKAKIALPGGCAIGSRPVNYHLNALKKLGAEIELRDGYIHAKAKKLKGTEIVMEGITVTGTENLMMAATLAEGTTKLSNVAKEPEIVDLEEFLNSMGARVSGAGSDVIIIEGVKSLRGCEHTIPADRIEAGTYLVAAALSKGAVEIKKAQPIRMTNILEALRLCGFQIDVMEDSIQLSTVSDSITPIDITTAPFPGFPTDMQAQFTVLNALANGSSVVTENIFENRFMHVQELNRMGCNISVKGANAFIKGVPEISGAEVMATDLRASASLVLAGLTAKGETIVDRIYHIDRGYERIEEKLAYLGASIERLPK
ncbi:MAG: UDP-N-acetylglucosamine 1-carboxyvinyltransferase [Gammaproteobacteria bacterium]